jgi:hypothetical protein
MIVQRDKMRRLWFTLVLLHAILGAFRVHAESAPFTATATATGIPPPPPPKLPPIHYSFPQASESLSTAAAEQSDAPNRSRESSIPSTTAPRFASARQDIITRYIHESFSHRIYLTISASLVGCALSTALSYSIFGSGLSQKWLLGMAMACALLIWMRNNSYAELLRATSMAALLSWQRWQRIRRRYPTGRYLYAAVMRGSERRPFPDPAATNADDFAMLPACVAMAVLGAATVPGHIPLLPTSLTRIVAAILVGYTTTLPTRSGDLCRCLGMRVMMWLQDWRSIARQVELPRKTGVVASAVFDRALVLDRQHRLRHRLASAVAQGVAAVRRMQASNGRTPNAAEEMDDNDGGRPRRRSRDDPRSDEYPPRRRDEPLDDFRRDETVDERRRRSGYDNTDEEETRRRRDDEEYYSNRGDNRSPSYYNSPR